MTNWIFKVFLNNKTDDVISSWIEAQPSKVRAKIRTRIKYLEVTRNWPEDYCHKWVGIDHIFEIRIRHSGIQYRLLGFFGPGDKEFTLLIGATKKKDLEPKSAPDIAKKRRKLTLEDRGYIDDFII
jgi:hypothetical protein